MILIDFKIIYKLQSKNDFIEYYILISLLLRELIFFKSVFSEDFDFDYKIAASRWFSPSMLIYTTKQGN